MKRLRQQLRQLLSHLLHEHTAPSRLAAAVLVGCVVGCTPLFGLHIVLCVALAWLFRLNKLVVYGAANLSIPPLVPFIGFASVQLGERLRHHQWLNISRDDFRLARLRATTTTFVPDWLVGGVALGIAIGLVAGAAVWLVVAQRRRRQRRRDPVAAAIALARRRYDGLHPRFKWYARMKYVMDPCYRAIVAEVPPGAFAVDLGSGLGMLPVLLGVMGEGRRALGVEWDEAKVACGRHAQRDLPGVEVVAGDARSSPMGRKPTRGPRFHPSFVTTVSTARVHRAPPRRAASPSRTRRRPPGRSAARQRVRIARCVSASQ